MDTTYKFKIKHINNVSLLDDVIFRYTGLYHKLYNNIELSKNLEFIDYCLKRFNVDKTMYDYCMVDVNMGLLSESQIKKEKQKKIDIIDKKLIELKKQKTLTKRQKRQKKDILKKKSSLLKSLEKGVCFGGKKLLREITKLE